MTAAVVVAVRFSGWAGAHAQAWAGVWEVRASDVGVRRVLLPSRVGECSPCDPCLTVGNGVLSPQDEAVAASFTDEQRAALGHALRAVQEMSEYVAGERRSFTVPLDPETTSAFAERVHAALSSIPYGTQVSYGEVARMIDQPKAVRAVGTACGANPLPVIVPCHRVVRADGSIGHYTGGSAIKRALLDVEVAAQRSSH